MSTSANSLLQQLVGILVPDYPYTTQHWGNLHGKLIVYLAHLLNKSSPPPSFESKRLVEAQRALDSAGEEAVQELAQAAQPHCWLTDPDYVATLCGRLYHDESTSYRVIPVDVVHYRGDLRPFNLENLTKKHTQFQHKVALILADPPFGFKKHASKKAIDCDTAWDEERFPPLDFAESVSFLGKNYGLKEFVVAVFLSTFDIGEYRKALEKKGFVNFQVSLQVPCFLVVCC